MRRQPRVGCATEIDALAEEGKLIGLAVSRDFGGKERTSALVSG